MVTGLRVVPGCVADIVAVACPLTAETTNLIDAKALAAMKPSAHLINVARGKVVDEDALIQALQQKRIAAAGLRVLNLSENGLTAAGAEALAAAGLAQLSKLDLSDNPIGDAGAEALAASIGFPHLKHLDLAQRKEWTAAWALRGTRPIQPKQQAALRARYGADVCAF